MSNFRTCRWCAPLALALSIGCVRAERTIGPDGRAGWWRIACPGSDDDACYAKARELCPRGYRVAPVAESERIVDSDCPRSAYEVEFDVSKSCQGSLLVECN